MMAKRTRKYWDPTEEEIKKVESLAARGMEEQDIALCLGINPSTLSHSKAQLEQLAQAIKRGKAKGIAKVTAALLKNVDIGNVTAQIFYLKCQAKWREPEIKDKDNEVVMREAVTAMKELAAKCKQPI
jgi:N-acyl-D-aspartate/D-glutamate deacylase